MYHVHYLGDVDERGWVSNIMKFNGKKAYDEHVKKLFDNAKDKKAERQRLEKSFKSYPNRQVAWELAIAVAEEALFMTEEERKIKYAYVYEEILPPVPIVTETALVSINGELGSENLVITNTSPKRGIAKTKNFCIKKIRERGQKI